MVTEGNEADLHNTHFHGNTLLQNGHRVDQYAHRPCAVVALSCACYHITVMLARQPDA